MSIMRKNLAMPHTKWIDQCCNLLEEGNEHPTDASIKAFIQARSLTHRISDTFSSDPDMDSGPNEALLQMSMNNFRRELAQIESALRSSNEQKNRPLSPSVRCRMGIPVNKFLRFLDTRTESSTGLSP